MSSLRSTLDHLAEQFTSGVLAAIRTASLEELYAQGGARGGGRARGGGGGQPGPVNRGSGRLARRSPAQIEASLAKVIAAVKATKGKGLRAEEIRKQLGLDVREVPRVLREGLAKKQLRTRGKKRATTYFAT
jgi:hypothetical protein